MASSQNYIYTRNAKTGEAINERQVHTPFLQSDIGCTDIPNYIGIIGTPTIDPATDAVYFFSKTYIPNYRYAGNTGTYNGVYYFHGVDINTLQDLPGYPILIDGTVADNDDQKYFVGGIILQRPSLTQIGNMVYGGFGGHCDLFNYTGLVVGIDVAAKKVATTFSMMSGPLAPQTNVWDQNAGGGQAGIWMSGMGLSSDGSRIFMVTGNGAAHENQGTPSAGTNICHTLGEACVNLAVTDGGKLAFSDYFQPYDYQNMDGGDQDFGSGGISLLDPTVFKGAGVSRIGVTSGKNGKVYILNADNLGGYRLGPGGTDGIIQTITTNKAVFGGAGSYPGEGGYIYSTPVGYPTYAYKLGFTGAGAPSFALAGATKETSAGRVGVGIPTITSLNGKTGTAILWMTDPDAGLRAWYAVPDQAGVLKPIKMPQVNGINKFQRPGFGDTRLYVTDANGVLYCLGSPVNLPLNCTSPVDFGSVALGTKAYSSINCTALIPITSLDGMTVGDARFEVSNSTLPKGALAKGATFSIPVAWNLTTASVQNTPGASYGNTSPGVKSTALTIYTTNAVGGYSTLFPISLTGTEVSNAAFLTTAPTTLDFGGLVLTGVNDDDQHITSSLVLQNQGLAPLTITGYAYTLDELDDDDVEFTNTTFDGGVADMGFGFSSTNLPAVGSQIAASSSVSVSVTFTPVNGTGNYASFFQIWSTGGSTNTILEGSASTAPKAVLSISTSEGGWLVDTTDLQPLMDFGSVSPGSTTQRQIRICNTGGSVLTISKSKPPLGAIHVQTYGVDLHETQTINVNDCAYGTVIFVAPTTDLNTPPETFTNEWTLNTDDLDFGVHVVQMKGIVLSRQVGPTNSTGLSIYEYLGCFLDNQAGGRLLPKQPYVNESNTNGLCMTVCAEGGYTFAGTEYQVECYCGNVPPNPAYLDQSNSLCTYSCAGDASQPCGGNGGYIDIFYDATKYSPSDNYTFVGPSAPDTVANFNYLGCYSEGTNGRALGDKAPAMPADGGTLDLCAQGCQGYKYFGSEFGGECYCGNTLGAGSALVEGDRTVNGCNMICNGNQSEYCGGGNRLEMYVFNGSLPDPPLPPTPVGGPVNLATVGNWSYVGCYTEATGGRALTGLNNPIPGPQVSIENCTSACQGYAYAGMEYSQECYCGNTLGAGSVLANGGSDPNTNGCSMTCGANSTEYCGGANRLSLYHTNNTTPGSPPTTNPTPTGGPVIPQTVGNWAYYGCVSDGVNGRTLNGNVNPIPAAQNSVENCTSACQGYVYAGMEYSGECYCGNSFNGGALVDGTTPAATGCNMLCTGNSSEYCGGPNRLSVYKTNDTSVPSSTTTAPAGPTTGPVTVQEVASGYKYIGCYSEATNQRALQDKFLGGATVSIEACATFCSGYTYFGAEYSQECYCGNTIAGDAALVSGTTVTTTGCNMVCAANSTEYCGGGNRLNMYQKSANANLNVLAVPQNSSTTQGTASSGVSTALSTNSTTSLNSTVVKTTGASTGLPTVTSNNSTTSLSSTVTGATGASTGLPTVTSTNTTTATSPSSTLTSTSKSTSVTLTSATSTNTTTSVSSTVTTTSATTTNSTTSSSTTSTSASTFSPTPSQIVGTFQYVGCANDSTAARALPEAGTTSKTMTNAACQSFCTTGKNNYLYSGIEYGSECYCGTDLRSFSQPGQGKCKTACAGNSTEICGGPGSLSLWRNTQYVPPTTPARVDNYVSYGCFSDPAGARVLKDSHYANDTGMTVESCVSYCSKKNSQYVYAGVEYGQECWCGTTLGSNAVNTTMSSCSKVCSGNTTEFCGQSALLNVYYNDFTNQTQPRTYTADFV